MGMAHRKRQTFHLKHTSEYITQRGSDEQATSAENTKLWETKM